MTNLAQEVFGEATEYNIYDVTKAINSVPAKREDAKKLVQLGILAIERAIADAGNLPGAQTRANLYARLKRLWEGFDQFPGDPADSYMNLIRSNVKDSFATANSVYEGTQAKRAIRAQLFSDLIENTKVIGSGTLTIVKYAAIGLAAYVALKIIR